MHVFIPWCNNSSFLVPCLHSSYVGHIKMYSFCSMQLCKCCHSKLTPNPSDALCEKHKDHPFSWLLGDQITEIAFLHAYRDFALKREKVFTWRGGWLSYPTSWDVVVVDWQGGCNQSEQSTFLLLRDGGMYRY